MERPKIIEIEKQHVELDREVTGWEAEEILRKYGYSEQSSVRHDNNYINDKNDNNNDNNNLTFEEMVKAEELKIKQQSEYKKRLENTPKPITFDGANGYDTHVKWGSDDDLGFGFKIEVTTDMKLPKY